MSTSTGERPFLPWILVLIVAAACFLGCLCSVGGVGLYFLSRPPTPDRTMGAAIHPTPISTPSIIIGTNPIRSTATIPVFATQEEFDYSPTATAESDPDSWRQMGETDAKVVVEEFADYQCPYCGEFHADGEPILRTEYIQTGKVRFIFRNYPVLDGANPESGESHLAALGALCAGEQGKFWEYHDALFENQSGENSGGFAVPHLSEFALDLGLNGSQFDQCVQTKRYESVLDDDIQLGQDRGVQAVPTFLINGKLVLGFDQSGFFDAIDQASGE